MPFQGEGSGISEREKNIYEIMQQQHPEDEL